RDRKLKEERERKLKEEQERIELEKRKQKEMEMKIERIRKEREMIRMNFPSEPEKGNGTTLIRFKFPDGSSLQRRFLNDDKSQVCFFKKNVIDSIVIVCICTYIR